MCSIGSNSVIFVELLSFLRRHSLRYTGRSEPPDCFAFNILEKKNPITVSGGLCLIMSSLQVEEGWWSGDLNGKSGLFPSNFVKELDATGEDADSNDMAADETGKM